MTTFDFKSFHVRAMNAADEAEKAKINQELKDLYDALDESTKSEFNKQLEKFLVKEYAAIRSVIDGVKGADGAN